MDHITIVAAEVVDGELVLSFSDHTNAVFTTRQLIQIAERDDCFIPTEECAGSANVGAVRRVDLSQWSAVGLRP